jgi:PhnB protein
MSKASSYLPAGFHALTVHLTVDGAAQYIDFLKRVFDAVELTRSPSPDGRLLNASVTIANSVIMLNDLFPEFGGQAYRSGPEVRLTLYLPDADAAWAKAIAAGCKVVSPIRDQFWGDRYGEVEDPFGFVWAIATHLEDLTAAEIEVRRKKMFGGGPPTQPEGDLVQRL